MSRVCVGASCQVGVHVQALRGCRESGGGEKASRRLHFQKLVAFRRDGRVENDLQAETGLCHCKPRLAQLGIAHLHTAYGVTAHVIGVFDKYIT